MYDYQCCKNEQIVAIKKKIYLFFYRKTVLLKDVRSNKTLKLKDNLYDFYSLNDSLWLK